MVANLSRIFEFIYGFYLVFIYILIKKKLLNWVTCHLDESWSCRWGTRNHKNFSWMSVDYFLNTVVSCVLSDVVLLPQLTLSWLFLAPDLKSSCKACCVQRMGSHNSRHAAVSLPLWRSPPVKAIHCHAARCALVMIFPAQGHKQQPRLPATCECFVSLRKHPGF